MEDALKKQMEKRKKKAEKEASKAAKAAKQKEAEGDQPKADPEKESSKQPETSAPELKPTVPVEGENEDPNEPAATAVAAPVEPKPPPPPPPQAAKRPQPTLKADPAPSEQPAAPEVPPTQPEKNNPIIPDREEDPAETEKQASQEEANSAAAAVPKERAPIPPPAPKAPEENMDSDLQAKLAARRARAEDKPGADAAAARGQPKKQSAGRATAAKGEDEDLQAKLAARRARADGGATGGEDVLGGGGDKVRADGARKKSDEERASLVKFLQATGELHPGEAAASEMAGDQRAASASHGASPAAPAVNGGEGVEDAAFVLPGHSVALAGHEATFGESFPGGGRVRPWEAHADEGMVDAIVNMYSDREGLSKDGILGDAALMSAVEEAMKYPGALESVLQDALQGSDEAFDPCKEVPVQWGAAAAAASHPPPAPYSSTPITAAEPPPSKPTGPPPTTIPVAGTSVAPPPPPEPPVLGPPCGVGMVLRPSTRNLYGTFKTHKRFVVEVESLLPSAPAALSGRILPGDVLLSVRNEEDKVATAVSNKVDEAKRLILGPAGSVVVLKLTRGDSSKNHTQESFDVSLTRMPVLSVDRILKPESPAKGEEEEEVTVQDAVEYGDVVVSVDRLPLRQLQVEDVQSILTGETSALVEVRIRKQSGQLAVVRVPKHPVKRDLAVIRQMLRGTPPPPSPGKQQPQPPSTWQPPPMANGSQPPALADGRAAGGGEKRFLGSRTLAKANDAMLGNLSKVNDTVGGLFSKLGRSGANGTSEPEAAPESTSTFPPTPPSQPPSGGARPPSGAAEPQTASWAPRPVSTSSQQSNEQGSSAEAAPQSDLEVTMRRGGLGGQLETLLPRLRAELGVECADDLRYVEETMVTMLALPPVQEKKLLQVVEDVKRQSVSRMAGAEAQRKAEEDAEEVRQRAEREAAAAAAAEKAMMAQRILEEREQRKLARQQQQQLQDNLERMRQEEQEREQQQQQQQQQQQAGQEEGPQIVGHCFAFHGYAAQASHEVTLKAGEVVQVTRKHPSGWWEGILASGKTGWFPSTFVKEYDPQAVAPEAAQSNEDEREKRTQEEVQEQAAEAAVPGQEGEEGSGPPGGDGERAEKEMEDGEGEAEAAVEAVEEAAEADAATPEDEGQSMAMPQG